MKPILTRMFPGKFFTRAGGTGRWNSKPNPSIAAATERDARDLEMEGYLQRDPTSLKAKLGSQMEVVRSLSTESVSTKASGEERLVPASSKHKLSND